MVITCHSLDVAFPSALPECTFLLLHLIQLLSSHHLACHSNIRYTPDHVDYQTHEDVSHLVQRYQYCTSSIATGDVRLSDLSVVPFSAVC